MNKRPYKIIQKSEIPDLSNLPKPIHERIMDYLCFHERCTPTIISDQLGCSISVAQWNLIKLVREKHVRDLGRFLVKGRHARVFEYIKV